MIPNDGSNGDRQDIPTSWPGPTTTSPPPPDTRQAKALYNSLANDYGEIEGNN
jgi:hypothetical protein